MNIHNRYLTAILALGGQAIISRFLGLITTVLLARFLGPTALGIFSAVQVTANTMHGLGHLGVTSTILVVTASEDKSHQGIIGDLLGVGLLIISITACTCAMVTMYASSWLAQTLFKDPDLGSWILWATPLVLLEFLRQYCFFSLSGLHASKKYAFIMTIGSIIMLLMIIAALFIDGLISVIIVTILVQTGISIALLRAVMSELKNRKIILKLKKYISAIKEILHIGLPFYLSGLIAIPVGYYLMAYLSQQNGIDALGQLRVITTLTALITFLPSNITAATVANLASHHSQGEKGRHSFLRLSLLKVKLLWLFCLGMSMLMYSVIPFIILFLFGHEYEDVVYNTGIGFMVASLITVANLSEKIYFAARRSKIIFLQVTTVSMIFLILGLYLVPSYALMGYLLSQLIAYAIIILLALILLRNYLFNNGYKINDLFLLLITTILISSMMLWMAYKDAVWQSHMTVGLIGLVIVLLLANKIVSTSEKHALINIFKKYYLSMANKYIKTGSH